MNYRRIIELYVDKLNGEGYSYNIVLGDGLYSNQYYNMTNKQLNKL